MKAINLDEDVYNALGDIENVSGLVNDFLKQYCEKSKDIRREKLDMNLRTKEMMIKSAENEADMIREQIADIDIEKNKPLTNAELEYIKSMVNTYEACEEKFKEVRFNAFKRQSSRFSMEREEFDDMMERYVEEYNNEVASVLEQRKINIEKMKGGAKNGKK